MVMLFQTYLQSFLHSDMYIKYLSDLIDTVHLAHDTVVFPRQHTGFAYLFYAIVFAYQIQIDSHQGDLAQILNPTKIQMVSLQICMFYVCRFLCVRLYIMLHRDL